jgi:endonuclease YncB( thermonuclease family)
MMSWPCFSNVRTGVPKRLPGTLAFGLALVAAMPLQARHDTSAPYRLSGTVERVLDGDTLRLGTGAQRGRTVRLASVDAPEADAPGRPGQPFAQDSRRMLADLVQGRRVAAACYETDAYGRDICEVQLADGSSVNREMVRAGMAWANMEGRGKYLRDPALRAVQHEARSAHRGLWSQPDPVEPWRWRHACWRKGQCR